MKANPYTKITGEKLSSIQLPSSVLLVRSNAPVEER
jgi:hypothetical protein